MNTLLQRIARFPGLPKVPRVFRPVSAPAASAPHGSKEPWHRRVQGVSISLALGVLLAVAPSSVLAGKKDKPAPPAPPPQTVLCWMADGEGMQPAGDLEEFLVDRIGATGERILVDPATVRAATRVLGLAPRSSFEPQAAHQLAAACGARWVVWVKLVSRDIQPKRLLGFPYLFNHRRLDEHVFFDVRLYDAALGEMIGSKRLQLSDRGHATWQVVDDEPLDPYYNNDQVELHQRQRRLDWKAAAVISGYCSDVFRSPRLAALSLEPPRNARADQHPEKQTTDPVVHPVIHPQ